MTKPTETAAEPSIEDAAAAPEPESAPAPAGAAEPAKPAEKAEPAEAAKPAENAKPAEAAKPVEPAGAPAAGNAKTPETKPITSLSTDITAGPGGVMTNEVGVITGELTVRTEVAESGKLTVHVQYKEAEEWYVLTGGRATLKDPADLDAVHKIVVGILNRPEG
jgi:hypothetical protein